MQKNKLAHAIFIILNPEKCSFKSEPRLRLFQLLRWIALGGSYDQRAKESVVIFAAAAMGCKGGASLLLVTQNSLYSRDVRFILEECRYRDSFYRILTYSQKGIARGLNSNDVKHLDALCFFITANLRANLSEGKNT